MTNGWLEATGAYFLQVLGLEVGSQCVRPQDSFLLEAVFPVLVAAICLGVPRLVAPKLLSLPLSLQDRLCVPPP